MKSGSSSPTVTSAWSTAESLEVTEHPLGVGDIIASDATGLTLTPGVWVAGNVTDPRAQVMGSAAAGSVAGAAINADLIAEEAQRAVAARRDPCS
jgi:thioredoxin reductase